MGIIIHHILYFIQKYIIPITMYFTLFDKDLLELCCFLYEEFLYLWKFLKRYNNNNTKLSLDYFTF